MAEAGVVVEDQLGVERGDLPVRRDGERIDLDELGVLGHEQLVELGREADRAHGAAACARVEQKVQQVVRMQRLQRIPDEFVQVAGMRLDLDAALGREQHDRRLPHVVDPPGEVAFGLGGDFSSTRTCGGRLSARIRSMIAVATARASDSAAS